ncbi:hypothetical protein PPROV_000669600 [Pycnococcus provasolii]|uniref:Amidinotransferase n=1 Tax=Pycnococcus provasolii TaxID=41880 RepID=A0A830HL99_9CHLO|nr:hypothetical protein PPROV_000669600 [Pycnococcus provasolii]
MTTALPSLLSSVSLSLSCSALSLSRSSAVLAAVTTSGNHHARFFSSAASAAAGEPETSLESRVPKVPHSLGECHVDAADAQHLRLPFDENRNPLTIVLPNRRFSQPPMAMKADKISRILADAEAVENISGGGMAAPGTKVAIVSAPFRRDHAYGMPNLEALVQLDELTNTLHVCPSLFRPETTLLATEVTIAERQQGSSESVDFDVDATPLSLVDVLMQHSPDVRMKLITPTQPNEPMSAPVHAASTDRVLMVAPTCFQVNAEASADNTFMPKDGVATDEIKDTVLREFSRLHNVITNELCVDVELFTHDGYHGTPDAVFPNNWFSTHLPLDENGNGVIALYPMKCPNRRREVRTDMLNHVKRLCGPDAKLVDVRKMSWPEDGACFAAAPQEGLPFLEGTGSIVMDRGAGVAYVSLSKRADAGLANQWRDAVNKAARTEIVRRVVPFKSFDSSGGLIYHTNVMMMVGSTYAIVCLEAIHDMAERSAVENQLAADGKEVVAITKEQMACMAGNALELQHGLYGVPYVIMSTQARESLDADQVSVLERHVAGIAHADIRTLETLGGGSVRCTIAELFCEEDVVE